MSDDTDDSSLDIKKRARRRLVGAAALALFAVIVLPVVMDSEPRPVGQDIEIRIPGKESEVSVAVSAPTAPAAPVGQTAPLKPAPEPLQAEGGPDPAVSVESASDGLPGPAAPAATTSAPAKPAEIVRAEAALEGKESGQWVVQLGAYQNEANVKQLVARLKEMKLPYYTEKFDAPQGTRTRVRAGPFGTSDAAERARLRINKIGVNGSIAQK